MSSSYPLTGEYLIKNYPHNTTNATVYAVMRFDKISIQNNIFNFRYFMTMTARRRAWADTAFNYSVKVYFYDNAGNKTSESEVISHRVIFKKGGVNIGSLFNSGKFYNWNFTKDSYRSQARTLGLKDMSYSQAKSTATANGLTFYSGCLCASEPHGIRYASDDGSRVVYSSVTKDYNLHPTYVDVDRVNRAWPTGFGRSDSDQGVAGSFTIPQGAAYFRVNVSWYSAMNGGQNNNYTFPEDGQAIPDDYKLDTASRIYNKRGSWQKDAIAYHKESGTWQKRNVYHRVSGSWVQL